MRKYGWLIVLTLIFSMVSGTASAQDTTCNLNSEEAYISRGRERWTDEEWEESIVDFNCALQINPQNMRALFSRGYAYAELREYTSAEADYNVVLANNPNDSAALNNRGNIYSSRGEYERALADYDRSIELRNDEKFIPYYNRGSVYLELGDYERALSDLNESLALNSGYDQAYLARGHVYRALGDNRSNADWAEYVNLVRKRTIDRDAASAMRGEVLGMSEGSVFSIPFEAGAGQLVRVAANTKVGSELDPLLVVLAPDGTAVAADDDSGINLDAVARFTAPASGTYTLLVTHAGGGSEGEAVLTLSITGQVASVPTTTGNATATSATPIPQVVETGDTLTETFLTYNLAVNDTAVVFTTGFDRLNLRQGPGISFEIIGRLFREDTVTLLEGPRKADGYAWWRVRTQDGVEGWAVERVETEQTLQPALAIGAEVIVTTDEDALRMREGAGRNFTIVTQLPPGVVAQVIDGPQIAEDLTWWKIRTADGIEGWAVERVEDDRTLSRNTGTLSSVPPSVSVPTPAAVDCSDSPSPRLVVGESGRVMDDDPLPINMRSAAGVSNVKVMEVPAGSVFTVLEGPVCVGRYQWYRVNFDGTEGWIAEGEPGAYYTEPIGG